MIKNLLTASALSFSLFATTAYAQSAPNDREMEAIQASALLDNYGWDIVEGLTTEIGSRLAGTEDEARARAWAVQKLKSLGFNNARIEPFSMDTWVRGEETASIIAPFPHKLHVTALGNSAATPANGIEAEVVMFPTLESLQRAPAGSLAGKIAFVNHDMKKTQDGSGYGYYGQVRRAGPQIAAEKGALAIVIRSVGTDHHRNPHTGVTRFSDGTAPIPAAAMSVPDAENLMRIFKRGKPVKMALHLTPKQIGTTQSGNVITDIKGSNPELGMIVIGCHLDSWDLGTGAIDDGAGCAIVTAAAMHVRNQGQPKRSIRIFWAGAEEVGLYGGSAYVKAHADDNHAMVMESDFGAGRIWRSEFNLNSSASQLQADIQEDLGKLGVTASTNTATGGPDVRELMVEQGLGAVDLQQDGTDYFDAHHTPDDTLDRINLDDLRQNIAAWTTVLSHVSNYEGVLKPE